MLERRAAVDYGVETVEALAIVGDGQFHIRIVEDALGLRCGISVVDRHIDRADCGQCEVEHTPLVAGGGEDGDGVALGDAERDKTFGGGDHILVKFAGSDFIHWPGAVLRSAITVFSPVRAMRPVSRE
mgnify:CR=1 FL=1